MRRPSHRADIQGLRALAVLAVVAYHLDVGVTGGFLGVDVFFVVSGFVICNLLRRELSGGASLSLRRFYGRRARRLLPALAVFVPVVLAASAVATNPYDTQPFTVQTAVSAQVFVANQFLYRHIGYFDGTAAQNSFLHMWSLSIEEQFYLAFPVALLVAWRWRRDRGATVVVAVGAVVSLGLALGLTHGVVTFGVSVPERLAYFAAPARAWEFLAGALLALQWHRVAGIGRRTATALGALGLGVMLLEFLTVESLSPDVASIAVVPVLGTVLVIVAGSCENPVTRALGWRPLLAIGGVSYAWYLWHWPAIVLTRLHAPEHRWLWVLAAMAALVPAALSTRFVERPLRVRPMSDARTLRLVAVCTIAPLLAAVVAWTGAQRGWGVEVPIDWYETADGRESGCTLFNRDVENVWPEDPCTTTVDDQQGLALILGDQHADSVSPGVIEAAAALGFGTALWNRTDCPFSGATPLDYPLCEEWNADALDLVDRLRPDVVVVANSSPAYVDPESPTTLQAAGGGRPTSRAEAVRIWRRGFAELLDELEARGAAVVVVGSAPDFGTAFPRSRVSVIRPEISIPTIPVGAFKTSRRDVFRAESTIVAQHPHMAVADPAPALCRPDCRAARSGTWWYYEPAYLTKVGGEQLAPSILDALTDALAG